MGLQEEVPRRLSRRKFLAAGAWVLTAGALGGWRNRAGRTTRGPSTRWVPLGSVDRIIAQSQAGLGSAANLGQIIQVPYRRPQGGQDFVFVRFVGGAEGLAVFSPYCTHQGARVVFVPDRDEFYCPCHGGRYTSEGRVCAGPGEAPLGRMPWSVRGTVLWVRLW